jgi:hypothetical protein
MRQVVASVFAARSADTKRQAGASARTPSDGANFTVRVTHARQPPATGPCS